MLAEFVCAAVDVVVLVVGLAHPMPGQSRIEHGDSPPIFFPAGFGALVQVLRQQLERDGIQMTAEAKMGGDGRNSTVTLLPPIPLVCAGSA